MARAPALLSLALLSGAPACGAHAPPERPNIVILVADDMDYEQLGFLGHPLAPTPAIDELARAGVVFTHGFVPMSRCRPSQAALLSGLWPHQNGVYFNVGSDHIDPATSLVNHLKRAGYAAIGEGKFWEKNPRLMGFSNYTIRNYETFVRWDQDHLFEFIDAHAGVEPLFVWWAPQLPHKPFDPPERLLERFPAASIPVPAWLQDHAERYRERERTSLAMVAWLDEGVAALVAKLRAAGLLENTLFVFLIDNGWANGLVSKGWAYDKGLRTPMILSWGRGIAGGRSFANLVSPVDLYATILDYAGAPIPEHCQGQSLRPCLEGRAFEPRPALYGALYPISPGESESPERDAYALWARTERWKYVLVLRDVQQGDPEENGEDERDDVQAILAPYPERRRGDEELYDLERDPYELDNLAARPEQRALMDRLRGEILAWWRATGGGPLDVP